MLLHAFQGFQTFLYYLLRKRNITEFLCELLAVSESEVYKLLYRFAYGRIVVFLVQKKPGKSSDRIDFFTVRIGGPCAQQIWRELGRGQRGLPRSGGCRHKCARLVLERREGDFVVYRVSIFNVPDCSRRLLDQR